jgi:hypothetical protein
MMNFKGSVFENIGLLNQLGEFFNHLHNSPL